MDKEIEKELEALKAKVEANSRAIGFLLNSEASFLRRVEALQEYITVVSELARTTLKAVDQHMDDLRKLKDETPPVVKGVQKGIEFG